MNLAWIVILALSMQGVRPRENSAATITSSDAYTRQMEDRMQVLLEAQNEKELTSPKNARAPNPHETAMLRDMEKHLEKLQTAVNQKSYKDIESLSGKIVTGVKFFIPDIEKQQTTDRVETLAADSIGSVFDTLGPGISAVVKGLREGVLNLRLTAEVVSQLRTVQKTAKSARSAKR